MRNVNISPTPSGAVPRRSVQSTALLRSIRTSICCLLMGAMFVGAAVPPAHAMDGNGQRFPLNQNDQGNIGPNTGITINNPTGPSTSTTHGAANNAMGDETIAAIGQPPTRNYRPQGNVDYALLKDLAEQVFLATGLATNWSVKKYSNTTNMAAIKSNYAAISLGSLTLQWARAILVTLGADHLHRRHGWSRDQAKLAAYVANVGCKWVIDKIVSFATSHVDNNTKDELRRRTLLANGFKNIPPGLAGNAIKDYAMALSKAQLIDGRVYFPPLGTCPEQAIVMPDVTFGTDQVFNTLRWTFNRDKWIWEEQPALTGNTNVYQNMPVKIVSDGDRTWMLANRTANGFQLYVQDQRSDWKVASMLWSRVPGEFIDIYPGPTHMWGMNKDHTIFACAQPCGGRWLRMNGKGGRIAIGARVANGTTNGQPVSVWIRDGSGKVFSRAENYRPNERWVTETHVPIRVKALLDERDPSADWADANRFVWPADR